MSTEEVGVREPLTITYELSTDDLELQAVEVLIRVMEALGQEERQRVADYVMSRYGLGY